MGYLSLALMGITIVVLVFGFLLGLMRGLNRSLLRFGLVIVSAVIAFLARDFMVGTVMGTETGEGTVEQMIIFSLQEAGMPESIMSLVLVLCEIMIGLLGFYLLFIVLQFITWIVLFPILKIFVKKGEHKRALLGGVVGAVQGLVIAFLICSPLTGAISQVSKLASIEVQGEAIFEIPEEIGFEEFVNSPTYGFYNATGGWFFDSLTTKKTDDGTKVSINDTVDITVAVSGIVDSVTGLQTAIENMSKEGVTMQEQVDSLKSVGDALIDMGSKIDELTKDAKYLVSDIISSVKDMAPEGEIDPDMIEFLENFDFEAINVKSLGKAVKAIASYTEKTSEELGGNGMDVTQQEVNDIIGGFADNSLILDLIVGSEEEVELMDVPSEYESMFEEAILTNPKLSEQQKAKLLEAFGV